jgi:hypothetical protein
LSSNHAEKIDLKRNLALVEFYEDQLGVVDVARVQGHESHVKLFRNSLFLRNLVPHENLLLTGQLAQIVLIIKLGVHLLVTTLYLKLVLCSLKRVLFDYSFV